MTYKFVTREEIEHVCKLPYSRFSHRHFLKRLLSERDAYREVAINLHWKHDSTAAEQIDSEAARIMEGRK